MHHKKATGHLLQFDISLFLVTITSFSKSLPLPLNTYSSNRMKVSSTVLLLGATVARRKAMAAPTFYTDRAAFNTAAGSGRSFESFEVEDAFSTRTTKTEPVDFGDFTFAKTLSLFGNWVDRTDSPSTPDAITDGQYALLYCNEDGSIGTFSFSNPIIAFAIDITFDSSAGLTIGGDVSQSISMTAWTPKFWGVIDTDGITELTFAVNGFYCIYIDSLSYVLPSEQPSEAPSVSGVPSTEVSNFQHILLCQYYIPKF